MANIINLNKHRKTIAKAKAKETADANAVRFGRTKAQKQNDAEQTRRIKKQTDDHRLEDS